MAFLSVIYSVSSDIMMFQLNTCLCDFIFSHELNIDNSCNASDVSSKYRVRGVIFHDGEELLFGMSILMRSMFCNAHNLKNYVFS